VPPGALVATQGHTLRARDLLATLTVEAAIHHFDLVAHLGRPGPAPGPLLLVRRTLDGLLGCPVPFPWTTRRGRSSVPVDVPSPRPSAWPWARTPTGFRCCTDVRAPADWSNLGLDQPDTGAARH
jgi:hypothetical protein